MSASVSILSLSEGSPLSPVSPSPKSSPTAEEFLNSPQKARLESITEHVKADHGKHQRTSSAASVQFRPSPATSQVEGTVKSRRPSHFREASPPLSRRFHSHVSFDNLAEKEPTKKNTISITLNETHKGYQWRRRSRIFMIGVDGNDYSDIALQWLLDELVDDGDHIVCLKVVDRDSNIAKDSKSANDSVEEENKNVEKKRKEFQKEANELMRQIQKKNDAHRAIAITLEFAVGKVPDTFSNLIGMYEPSMLIVGTRGRSLEKMKSVFTHRTSFSKWCLQHSPIPVVVVRPTEKRVKKREKREANPLRQDYIRILRDSGVKEHEIIGRASNNFVAPNDGNKEAQAVAAALGLPVEFDPMLKIFHPASDSTLQKVDSAQSNATATAHSTSPDSRSVSPTEVLKRRKSPQIGSPALSGDEAEESEDEDEEDGEFEVAPGHTLLGDSPWDEKSKKLHDMEQHEAGALLLGRTGSVSSAGSSGSGGGGAPILGKDGDE